MNNLLVSVSPTYILSQAFALVSLCLMAVSYFCKSKKVFFILQTAGNFCIVLSFAFLGELFASVGTVIATVRTGVFALYAIKGKEVPWWLVGVILGVLLLTVVLSYSSAFDLLYFVGLCIYVLSFKMKDFISLKIGLFFGCVLYIVYDFALKNYVNGISHIVELSSIVISIVLAVIMKNKQKKNKGSQKEYVKD